MFYKTLLCKPTTLFLLPPLFLIAQFDQGALTSKSCGDPLSAGLLIKQALANSCASTGKLRLLPSNCGAGSLTMCCNKSRIDIVCPSPPSETPFFFFRFRLRDCSSARFGRWDEMGKVGSGSYSPSPSESSGSEEASESWNGNRPVAISIKEMPRDQTSDLIV